VTELKRFSLIRPTLNTRFHIDFEWWRQNDNDSHIFLAGLLCPEHQQAFSGWESDQVVDWVDPITAEVQPVDGIQHLLITHCAKQEGFITPFTTLVDAVFRLFLANGNTPMTPIEMGEALRRPPDLILKTLSGGRVYRGMRPVLD
jgi:hypothetical protein